jgi:hypothetical protein
MHLELHQLDRHRYEFLRVQKAQRLGQLLTSLVFRLPIPHLTGVLMLGSLFPRDLRRYLSLPLLGPIVDSFDDWLASNGYTQLSRKQAIYDLAHVDAQLRRRRIKEISNLTLAVLDDCRKSLIKKHPRCAGTVRPLERYLVTKSLIVSSRTRYQLRQHRS